MSQRFGFGFAASAISSLLQVAIPSQKTVFLPTLSPRQYGRKRPKLSSGRKLKKNSEHHRARASLRAKRKERS
jgi:hypothetical protein